jgi:hypothetical protein
MKKTLLKQNPSETSKFISSDGFFIEVTKSGIWSYYSNDHKLIDMDYSKNRLAERNHFQLVDPFAVQDFFDVVSLP